MPGNKYDDDSEYPSSRTGRLLRERHLKKISKTHSSDPSSGDTSELESCQREDGNIVSNVGGAVEASSPADGQEKSGGGPFKQRILVVANRLPITVKGKDGDRWKLEISAGGLVSALLGVKDIDAKWIGWAGVHVPDEAGQRTLTETLAEKRCIPVLVDQDIFDQYYNGFCNNILWPLFHYMGATREDRFASTRSFESQFDAYIQVNQMFADVVNQHYEEGDIVWCHDFHLMFLPKCLKEHNSKMKVGWFLHTPFPSSEIHRTLPSRAELLRAVLAADLVGFHTYDYARHFVSACTRILGLEATPEGVEDQGRLTRVAVFPIGIDPERFIGALGLSKVQDYIREFKDRYCGRKVILGVERLDTVKGIPQKILAFEKFLEENPDWLDKVVLVQIAVPSRKEVPEYQKLTSQVHEIVGRVNGRFGSLTTTPIHHLDKCLHFDQLCALYAVTDIALVTSLRDGMNLVSYEFVACQDNKKGVLILSEFAGAAQSLGAGAILVNPWNITEVASSIRQALSMRAEEREKRHHHNFHHVTSHTSQEWAETFISELNDTLVEAQQRIQQVLPNLPIKDAIRRYCQSNNRLLILGFNSTLTEPVDTPGGRGDQIREMELQLHPDLKGPLQALCGDPKTTIVVLSGSNRTVLEENFVEYNMWLAAENGMFLHSPEEREWMLTMPEHSSTEWLDKVKEVFEYFTERTPRSFIEFRDYSLVWNYKYADVEFGRLQAKDMLQHLRTGPISNCSVDIVQGSRSVEVRAAGVTKGAAFDRILGQIVRSKFMPAPIDYVLCVGHFLGKDEDVYSFFEPELPAESKLTEPTNPSGERSSLSKVQVGKNGSKSSPTQTNQLPPQSPDKAKANNSKRRKRNKKKTPSPDKELWNVLDLKADNYFSCTVGRTRSKAHYLVETSQDVVSFIKELACGFTPANEDALE